MDQWHDKSGKINNLFKPLFLVVGNGKDLLTIVLTKIQGHQCFHIIFQIHS